MESVSAALRPLAWSCYAIGLLLCLAPLGDLAAGVATIDPGGVPWRFGVSGLLSGALVLPALGLGLVLLAAVLLGHRGITRLGSTLAAILMIALVVLLVVFLLDTFQLRAQVRQDAKRAFDLAALKASVTLALEAGVFTVLALNGSRAVPHRSGRRSGAGPLVVPSHDR